jgi:hypothetical protein
MLAATIWPPSFARDEAVRRAANGAIDWQVFLRLVDRHRVAGIVQAAFTMAAFLPPSAPAAILTERATTIARNNLKMAAETIRLQRAFDRASIDVCFFKGCTAAMTLYGDLAQRHSKDIDLLVKPSQIKEAYALIERLGYRRIMPPSHLSAQHLACWLAVKKEIEFLEPRTGLQLELHTRLLDSPYQANALACWNSLERVALASGALVNAPQRAALFVYLCAHGADHGWMRLKWLVDIAAFVAADDAEQLIAADHHRWARRCIGQALLLCQDFWGLDLPGRFTARLHQDRRTRWLAAVARYTLLRGAGLTELSDTVFGQALIKLASFLQETSLRFYASQFEYVLRSPYDIVDLQLPSRWTFLYPFLRLPMWLWRILRKWCLSLPPGDRPAAR